LKHIYQELPSECGLACLATVFSRAGRALKLADLRAQVGAFDRGMTFADMISVAHKFNITARAFKLAPKHLSELKLPAILHWRGNHFVVLEAINDKTVDVFDPADGPLKLPMETLMALFSGAALELDNLDELTVAENPKVKPKLSVGAYWWWILSVLLLFIVLAQLMLLLMPLYVQVMIDQFIELDNFKNALWLLATFSGLVGLKLSINLLIDYLMLSLNRHLSLEMTQSLFKHILKLPIVFIEQRDIGDTVTRFRSIDEVKTILLAHLLPAIGDAVFSLFALLFVVMLFPYFATYLVPVILLVAVLRYRNMSLSRREMERAIKASSQEQTSFIESIQGIGNIKRHRMLDHVGERWLSHFKESLARLFTAEWLTSRSSHIHHWVQLQEMLVTVFIAAAFIHAHIISLGQLFALLSYRAFLHERIASLIEHVLELMYVPLYIDRLSPLVTAKQDTKPELLMERDEPITVTGLSFGYQEALPIIDGLSATISPGTLTLISGASGRGKSTLLKLLNGDLNPDQGIVRIGEFPANQYDLSKAVSFLAPNSTLIRGSILGNVTGFADEVDTQWLGEVLKISCLEPLINQLPMGVETVVEPQANNLSSGQAQRVLIAQAIYRKPRYLLMDEATSHLDPQVEYKIWTGLKALGITIVAVVHTPQAEAISDQIINLK